MSSKLEDALRQLGYQKLVLQYGNRKKFKEGNYTSMQVEAHLDEEEEWWPGTMDEGPTKDDLQVLYAQTDDGVFKIRQTYSMYCIGDLLEELLVVA